MKVIFYRMALTNGWAPLKYGGVVYRKYYTVIYYTKSWQLQENSTIKTINNKKTPIKQTRKVI